MILIEATKSAEAEMFRLALSTDGGVRIDALGVSTREDCSLFSYAARGRRQTDDAIAGGRLDHKLLEQILAGYNKHNLIDFLVAMAVKTDKPRSAEAWRTVVYEAAPPAQGTSPPPSVMLHLDDDSALVPWEYWRLQDAYLYRRHPTCRVPCGLAVEAQRRLFEAEAAGGGSVGVFFLLPKQEIRFPELHMSAIAASTAIPMEMQTDGIYGVFTREMARYPLVHLFCHGPTPADRGALLPPQGRPVEAAELMEDIRAACALAAQPLVLILSVCGGARVLTPAMIRELFEETRIRNLVLSSYRIPIATETFCFYHDLYDRMAVRGHSIGQAFHEAQVANPLAGAIHELWGSLDTYWQPGPVSAGRSVSEAPPAVRDSVYLHNMRESIAESNYSRAQGYVAQIRDETTRIEATRQIETAQTSGQAIEQKLATPTGNPLRPGHFIDGWELGRWHDGEDYHPAVVSVPALGRERTVVFHDYREATGSLRVRIPVDQTTATCGFLDERVRSLSDLGAVGLQRYHVATRCASGGGASLFYAVGDIPEGEPIASATARERIGRYTPVDRVALAIDVAVDLLRTLAPFHERHLYYPSLRGQDVLVVLGERRLERISIDEAVLRVCSASRLPRRRPSHEEAESWAAAANMAEVAAIVLGEILDYPVSVAAGAEPGPRNGAGDRPSGSKRAAGDPGAAVVDYYSRRPGYEALAREPRFKALAKLACTHVSQRYRSATEAADVIRGNDRLGSELKRCHTAGYRLFYVLDANYEETLTREALEALLGLPVPLDVFDLQAWEAEGRPADRLLVADMVSRFALYALLEPRGADGQPLLAALLGAGVSLLILDLWEVFGEHPGEWHRMKALLKRMEEMRGCVVLTGPGFYRMVDDRSLTKSLRIIATGPYDRLDYYRQITAAVPAGFGGITADVADELAGSFAGLTLHEAGRLTAYLAAAGLLGATTASGRRSYVNDYRMNTLSMANRAVRPFRVQTRSELPYDVVRAYADTLGLFLRSGIPIHARSLVLTGYPGNAVRRMVSHAVAGAGFPCFEFDLSSFLAGSPGLASVGEMSLALARIRSMAPCALVISGFVRSLVGQRGGSAVLDRLFGTVLAWLQEIDISDILVVAYDEVSSDRDLLAMSSEMLRAGRFATKLFLDHPDADSVETLAAASLCHLGCSQPEAARASTHIRSLRERAKPSYLSIEDIEAIVCEGATDMAANGGDIVDCVRAAAEGYRGAARNTELRNRVPVDALRTLGFVTSDRIPSTRQRS